MPYLAFSSCRSVDEKSQLESALKRGDIEMAEDLIQKGALDDFSVPKGISLVREEIYSVLRIIQLLLSSGIARINTEENYLEKVSREKGAFDVVLIPGTSLMTRMVVNVTALKNWGNKTIEDGRKPIHVFSLLPGVSPAIIEIILENGVDNVNTRANSKVTPLMCAALRGNMEVVKFLIDKGARINDVASVSLKGEKFDGHFGLSKLFSKTELNSVNTDFHYSALVSAVVGNRLDVINYLIKKGADINNKGQSWLALFHAVYDNRREAVEILLRKGINVNAKDMLGSTALHKAAELGNTEMAKLLLKHGARLDATDALGWMPIHVASFSSKNGGKEMIQFLVQSGSSIKSLTDGGYSPLNLVEAGYNPSFLTFLQENIDYLKRAQNYTDLPEEDASKTHTDIVDSLIQLGASLNHQDGIFGWSTLHWAAASGDLDTAKLLVKYGASVSVRSKTDRNPYETAQYFGRKKVADFLRTAKDLV